jgi:hypothetical protein
MYLYGTRVRTCAHPPRTAPPPAHARAPRTRRTWGPPLSGSSASETCSAQGCPPLTEQTHRDTGTDGGKDMEEGG